MEHLNFLLAVSITGNSNRLYPLLYMVPMVTLQHLREYQA